MGVESRRVAFHSVLGLSELYGVSESSAGLSDKNNVRSLMGLSGHRGWQLCQEPRGICGATCVN